MKNRTKSLLILMSVALLAIIPFGANAQKRQISVRNLPQPAISFLTKNFDMTQVWKCMIGDDRRSFEVYFSDGTEVDFDKQGRWEEIENEKVGINKIIKNIAPEAIGQYIKENYPSVPIHKIEHNRNKYEVTLKTTPKKTELEFNKGGKFLKKSVD